MMWQYGDGTGWWMLLWGGLMMLLFWGVVIVGLVVAIRWLVGQGRPPQSDRALDILRQRYASGEIGKEEFEANKRDRG